MCRDGNHGTAGEESRHSCWCVNPFSHLLPITLVRESFLAPPFPGNPFPRIPPNAMLPDMGRYRADEHVPYFCTITVLDWLPVFIDRTYIDAVIDSLKYCRDHKNLAVFAFVVMPNHVHLVAGTDGDLHSIMRDFKRFTSRTIHDRLKAEGRVSLLKWLSEATESARRTRGDLGLWQSGFHPQAIYSRKVFDQKVRYIHENPVRKGLVLQAEDWWYSSAREEAGLDELCMSVDPIDF